MEANEVKVAKISGKYAVISALIAAIASIIGIFGGMWYQSTKTENIQVDLYLKQEEVDQLEQDKQELQTDNNALAGKVLELETLLGIVQGEQNETNKTLKQQYEELKMQYSEIAAQNDAIQAQLDNMGIDIPQTKDSPEENSTLESDSVWLSNLDYLDSSGSWEIGNISKSNTGTEYSHSINNTEYDYLVTTDFRLYKIYGQYSRITGYFFQEYDSRTEGLSTTLCFYGDDRELLNKEMLTVNRGSDPIYFEVDVTGVTNLTIEVDGTTGCSSLGEVALWK